MFKHHIFTKIDLIKYYMRHVIIKKVCGCHSTEKQNLLQRIIIIKACFNLYLKNEMK